jgi:nitroreductase
MLETISEHSHITKAIHRSQHCQRNWDLSKEIPEDDLNLLITAATQCPSKQNIAFYKVHFITNRDVIESVHTNTVGFGRSMDPTDLTTNSQTLANLLVVFEDNDFTKSLADDKVIRSAETQAWLDSGKTADEWVRDRDMAIGIAAGYLNLTASLMGYGTGCCACFDDIAIKKLLGLSDTPVLLMGIGFKNPLVNRRVHHKEHDFVFPTKPKQTIPTTVLR